MSSFEKSVVPPKDFRIIQILCIVSAIFIVPAFWLFSNKSHKEWLSQTKKQSFTGIITNKEIKRGQYLLTLKTNSTILKDTSIEISPWGKLFDECQLNDTLIKKANSFDIIIKRNNDMLVFPVDPAYL